MMCRLFRKPNKKAASPGATPGRDPMDILRAAVTAASLPEIVPGDLQGRRLERGADLTALFEASAYRADRRVAGGFRAELLRDAVLFRSGRKLVLAPEGLYTMDPCVAFFEAGSERAENLSITMVGGLEMRIPIGAMIFCEGKVDAGES